MIVLRVMLVISLRTSNSSWNFSGDLKSHRAEMRGQLRPSPDSQMFNPAARHAACSASSM